MNQDKNSAPPKTPRATVIDIVDALDPPTAPEPVLELDPRAVALLAGVPPIESIRFFGAFQALGLPAGMTLTRGFSRTNAADMINGLIGIKAVTRSSKPPRKLPGGGSSLAGYVSWAIAEAERRHPGLRLEVVEA